MALWSCSDAADVTDIAVPATAQADVFGAAPIGAEQHDISAMTEEERNAYGAALIRMRIDLEQAMATPGGWQEAHQRTRALLDDYPEIEDYKVQQTAGTMIVRTYLLTGEVDDEKAEALGYYTDMLVQSGSPNTPLIERALTSLAGYWDDQKLSTTAAAAAAAGERFVAAQEARGGPPAPEGLERVASTGMSDTRAARVAEAVVRLRETAR